MKWTQQRKLSAGVLALAAGAFLIDAFVIRGGADASASGAGPVAAVTTPAVAAGAATSRPDAGRPATGSSGDPDVPAAALAKALAEAAAAEGLPAAGASADAFRPPAAWYPDPAATAATPSANPADPASRASAFRAAYRLTAVMRTGPRPEQGVAVLHGAKPGSFGITARVGQRVDGFVLRAVHDRGVTLADDREQFDLTLPEVGLATAN
jgi:hypothetical protein